MLLLGVRCTPAMPSFLKSVKPPKDLRQRLPLARREGLFALCAEPVAQAPPRHRAQDTVWIARPYGMAIGTVMLWSRNFVRQLVPELVWPSGKAFRLLLKQRDKVRVGAPFSSVQNCAIYCGHSQYLLTNNNRLTITVTDWLSVPQELNETWMESHRCPA